MKETTVYAIIWIVTGTAASIAVYVTSSAVPLIFLLIPTFVIGREEKELIHI